MKVLSFDVGIINLAYFLVNFDEYGNFDIEDYGVLDLADGRKKCEAYLRTKRYCGCNAKYICNEKYLCEKHKNNSKPEIKKVIKKSELLCNFKKCNNKAVKQLKNEEEIGWCNEHFSKEYNKLINQRKLKPRKIASQNSNNISHKILFPSLVRKLDDRPHLIKAQRIIIENQPSLMNPTMKTMSAYLYSYFFFRTIMEIDNGEKIDEIDLRYTSPGGKLKVNENDSSDTLNRTDKKRVYNITKELGKKYSKLLLPTEVWNNIEKYDKMDDLCDAFLQAFYDYYQTNDQEMPSKYKELLKQNEMNLKDNKKENNKKENNKKKNNKKNNKKKDNSKEDNTKEDNTKEDNTKEDNTKENNTKEDNTKEDNTKENNFKEEN
jgi:hypothetical protein